jgi:serine/threonine protein phosphatase PrpC
MTTIDSFHFSDPGQKRANNEDAAGALEPKDARQLKRSGRLYLVADGLGGHQMGEKASAYAVETLLKVYYEAPDIPPEKRLRDIIQQVNRYLIAYAQKNVASGEKVATTIVAAVVRNGTLLVANVGDSRAYLLRNGEISQITRDHSFVGEMMRAGAITEAEAQQSKYRNRLTRSVGGSDANLEVELYPPIPLRPGDTILLCTDGLTQYATAEDLLAATSYGSAQQIVERLIRFANTRGGSDNITASIIKYGKKSALPAALPIKTLAAIGAGLLTLAILALLSWYVFIVRPAARVAPVTPTVLPILTATSPANLTLEPIQTALSTPSETPLPELTVPAPPPTSLVDCNYIVKAGDTLNRIIELFGTDQIFRGDVKLPDPNQSPPSIVYSGEPLTIKGISNDVCVSGDGTPTPQPAPAP